ncbi:MAG: hypothetical protein AAGD13_03155 [Pseudomonadota bacterium]
MKDRKDAPQQIGDDDLEDVNGGILGQIWEDVKETVQEGVDAAEDAVEQVAGWTGDQAGGAANSGWDATKVYVGTMASTGTTTGTKIYKAAKKTK